MTETLESKSVDRHLHVTLPKSLLHLKHALLMDPHTMSPSWVRILTPQAACHHVQVGLPEENDWILYGPETDKTMGLRNVISYTLARASGRYASRLKYCEVFITQNRRELEVDRSRSQSDS